MSESTPVDWSLYEVFRPGVSEPAFRLDRDTAQAEFDHLMEVKDGRVKNLDSFLEAHGVDMYDLEEVAIWFIASVAENPDRRGELLRPWYSITVDLGLYLGNRLVAESDNVLEWALQTRGKRRPSYHRAVIVGHRRARRGYGVDFSLNLLQMGHKLVQGKEPDKLSVGVLRRWLDDSLGRL